MLPVVKKYKAKTANNVVTVVMIERANVSLNDWSKRSLKDLTSISGKL